MGSEIDLTKFDDVFLGILQHLGKIEPFIEAMFFFLARRTDFFQLMHNRDDKMGFPPGVAEKIVLRIFKKYQKLVIGKQSPTPSQEKKITKSSKKKEENQPTLSKAKITEIPEPIKTVEVKTSSPGNSTKEQKIEQPSRMVSSSEVSLENKSLIDKVQNSASIDNCEKKSESEDTQKKSESEDIQKKSETEDTQMPTPSLDPDSYNGAVTDKYSWGQMHGDVDVKVPIPKFVQRGKDIEVKITSDKLWIALKQDPPSDSTLTSKVLIDGILTHRIRHEECIWSLVPGECLQIHLEKVDELYWTALLEGEKEIDKTKLDTTRDISEFDQQTQADFQKVMYDHHQKLQGKPTSDEQKTHDLLKQAWDAEGSPFKGTPFDPSRVNISGGSGGI